MLAACGQHKQGARQKVPVRSWDLRSLPDFMEVILKTALVSRILYIYILIFF